MFVTAYEEHAVDAFEIKAEDYLLKPVRPERLAEAIRRVASPSARRARRAGAETETIPVELGGVTRFVPAPTCVYVEAQGDYARLHTATGSHLVRIPLATLEERWAAAGFVRVHRSHLVALKHIDELHIDSGSCAVRVGDTELPVSRRHTRELRDLLVRRAAGSGRPESSDRSRDRAAAVRRSTSPRTGRVTSPEGRPAARPGHPGDRRADRTSARSTCAR